MLSLLWIIEQNAEIAGGTTNGGTIWKFQTVAPYAKTNISSGPMTASNDGARCPYAKIAAEVNISGKVWHDANADAITNNAETGVNPGGNLYATLVNQEAGKVIASVLVDSTDGSYFFEDVNAVGIYQVILTDGPKTPGTTLTSADSLPSEWEYTGTNVDSTAYPGNKTGVIADIVTYGEDVTGLDFGIVTPNPVSVNLVYFEVTVQNGEPNLKWQTAEEQNNRGFEIERSPNGMDWTTIGFVGSIAHKGSSVGLLDYSFSDRTPLANKNFYRLKQLDNDGNVTYSYVRMVNLSKVYNPQATPNPASDVVIISGINGGERIAIYDITGSLIKEIVHTEGSRQVVSLTDMNAGVYYIHILSPNLERKVLKLVKQVN